MIVANFRLLRDQASRKRISLFMLCSIAGILPYAIGRILQLSIEMPALARWRTSPLQPLVEMLIVLSMALIPVAAAHAILFRRMFGISVGQEDATTGVREAIAALAALGSGFTLYKDRQRTVAETWNDPLLIGFAVVIAILWVFQRPAALRWLNEQFNSAASPKLRQCSRCGLVYGLAARKCTDCTDTLELKDIPRTLGGRYRLDRCIGKGGMGLVYQAYDLELERNIAIKILHPELAKNRSLVRRVAREAWVAAQLKHPNIVTIYDFSRAGDGPVFIVMELIQGKTLSSVISSGSMSPGKTAECFIQIFAAVEAAHAKGIVHRDLKPDNVLLAWNGEGQIHVTLLDFGIAKLKSGNSDTRLTQTGTVLGTPLYWSPEQREHRQVDSRSDIYSLGVIVTEVLTGSPPFPGNTRPDQIASSVRNEISLDHAPDLGQPLREAIYLCLATNPGDRFQSVSDLRNAVIPHLVA
jgi:hypothetical protein